MSNGDTPPRCIHLLTCVLLATNSLSSRPPDSSVSAKLVAYDRCNAVQATDDALQASLIFALIFTSKRTTGLLQKLAGPSWRSQERARMASLFIEE